MGEAGSFQKSEWKHAMSLKALAQNLHTVTVTHIPLATTNPMVKLEFHGTGNKLPLQKKEVQSPKTNPVAAGRREELGTVMPPIPRVGCMNSSWSFFDMK